MVRPIICRQPCSERILELAVTAFHHSVSLGVVRYAVVRMCLIPNLLHRPVQMEEENWDPCRWSQRQGCRTWAATPW